MQVTHVFSSTEFPSLSFPLYTSSVSAGFPSPADDFADTKLDLNDYLVKHPAATFFVRASGDSMIDAGIHSEDILIVDRSLEAQNDSIIIAVLNGELTVKRLQKKEKRIYLLAENTAYKPIEVTEDEDFLIWGVVTSVIHKVQ